MPKCSVIYFTICLFCLLMCFSQVSAKPNIQEYETFQNVQFVKNYDGDSITFNIPNAPAIFGKNMIIRLRGIDTPELKKKSCPTAMLKAKQAKQLVYSLLINAHIINLHHIGRGKYFRMLADVEFDGQDLATALLDQNLAVKYSGGKKESHWCTEKTKQISVRSSSRDTLPPKVSGVYVWPPPPVEITTQHTK